MAKRRQCSGCGEFNAINARECKNCGSVFGHAERSASSSPDLCAWRDAGRGCVCRGIIGHGQGHMYCREHWERVNGREPHVIGNALPPVVQSQAARRWHEQMAASKGRVTKAATGISITEWLQDETYGELQQRIREKLGREPGSDDDYADLVPETVGQA